MRGAVATLCAVLALVLVPVAATAATQGRSLTPTANQQFTEVVGSFDGPNVSYSASINWGDGSTTAGTVVKRSGESFGVYDVTGTHTYTQAGRFDIVVTVTAPGLNDSVVINSTADVTAPQEPPPGQPPPPAQPAPQPTNTPPTAALALETSTLKAGGVLALDASKSRDPDGSVISYAFDVDGNGSYETECGSSAGAVASYGSAGTIKVGVRIVDSAGAVSSTTTTLAVTGTAPAKGVAGKAPSGITLGGCRAQADVGKAAFDFSGSCLRTVTSRIAEAVSAGCFEELNEDPATAKSSQLPPRLPDNIRDQTQHYYVAGGTIKLNGLDVRPNSGSRIVIHKEAARLYTLGSGARVSLAAAVLGLPPVTLKTGKLDWRFPIGGQRLRIAEFDVAPAAGLFGFDIDGRAAVDLTGGAGGPRRAEVPVHLGLPSVFKDPTTGKGITADITLKADNARKLYLDGLRVDLPHAFLGGLEINNLFFEYRREESIWRGGAELIFPSGHKLDAVPPPSTQGIGFRDGGLEYAGAELTFPDPGVPVFSSVYLHRIGFTLETKPTRFTGTVNLTAGSAAGKTLADIDGTVTVVFASPSEPFVLRGKRTDSFAIAVEGRLTMLDTIPLAEAHVMYRYPYYIEAGGKLEYHIVKDRIFARATAGGWVDLGSAQFNIEAGADLCIDISVFSGCRGGSVVLSSRGMGGCVSLWFADVGGGIYWSGGGKIFFKSCDIGPFRATLSRAAQDGSFGVSVGRDAPFEAIEVTGRDAAPSVELAGPGGKRITTPASGFLDSAEAIIWRGRGDDKATWVLLPRSAAGRWSIAAAPGSQITSIRTAAGLPEPKVSGRLSGRGGKRTLSYDVAPLPGQTVRFVERGPATAHAIGSARGRRGRIPFRIAQGPAGPRTIVAVVENEGTVRKEITIARFRAPRPALPARPRGLKVRRSRGGLAVSWKRLAGAPRYVVAADVADGRRLVLTSRRTRVRIPAIPARTSARIRVAGLTVTNVAGKRASARVKVVKPRRARR